MDVGVRTIQRGEVADWFTAVRAGFLETPTDSAPPEEFQASTIDLDHTWAAVDGGRIVGTLRSWATTVAVPGGVEVSCAALTQVTVSATHRRRGLLTTMIESDLRACAARGDAVGALIAAEYPIYGRFGYGPAAESVELTLDATDLAFREPPDGGQVELVGALAYRAAAEAVHDRARLAHPGALARPSWWWDIAMGTPAVPGKPVPAFLAVGHDPAGGADGVLAYDIGSRWTHGRPRSTLVVRELIGTDPAAIVRLWRYAAGVDWVGTVQAHHHQVGDPVRWALVDGRAVSEHDRIDRLWLRLLDVPAALAGRRYLASGSVVLEVADPLGLAGGRVRLDVDGQDASRGVACSPTTDPADLALSVSTLGSAYLGGYTLAELARGGLVLEHRPGALAAADAMFRAAEVPWSLTDF